MINPEALFDTSIFKATRSWFKLDLASCGEGEEWVVGDEDDNTGDGVADTLAESVSTLLVFIVGAGDRGKESLASLFDCLLECVDAC
mmetsp:Transcript_27352/g.65740  ORF Transcript_27352/g.65740 Transcript_27352/m.65740 type:complete len:87 (+) Transcript_27352:1913-2173(+)